MIKNLLLVGTGGFIGSIARYSLSKLNLSLDFYSIPIGTLSVNVIGSFIIGILAGISMKSEILSAELQLLLMVGLCGGFTTFSSFSNENLLLMQNGQILTVLIYTGLSVILGFIAVYLGYIATSLF